VGTTGSAHGQPFVQIQIGPAGDEREHVAHLLEPGPQQEMATATVALGSRMKSSVPGCAAAAGSTGGIVSNLLPALSAAATPIGPSDA
jgi:hypothetical protein